jgi:hypothetical protein
MSSDQFGSTGCLAALLAFAAILGAMEFAGQWGEKYAMYALVLGSVVAIILLIAWLMWSRD